jgi:tRNA A37 threonylcarbamoyladenosine synthetase subunit TsaC/SUA5/YrdC
MARYFDVHPDNPQPRALAQVAEIITDGGLVAYPTDSG